MANKLKLVLIVMMSLFLIYTLFKIRRSKISTKHAIIWIVVDILIILCVIFIDTLFKIANFIGIETAANMLFFLGFLFMLLLCFNLSNQLSFQNKKIISLTQEVGLLKNEIDRKNKKNDK